jgi:phosphatidylglycerol:prolipoprotein diacylglycerol transferase
MGIVIDFAQPVLVHPITVWGFFVVLSAVVSYIYLASQFAKHKVKTNAFDFVTVAYTAGLIGSKLHSVAEGNFSGMNYQGGLVLASLVSWKHIRLTSESVSRVSDMVVVAVLLGHGIGKLGCFFSADGCYGTETDMPWGMSFPNGHIPTTQFVHPAPLYEAGLSWTAAWVLHKKLSASYRAWDNTILFFAFSGFARFVIEYFRPHPEVLLGLSAYQIISMGLVAVSMMMHVRRRTKIN